MLQSTHSFQPFTSLKRKGTRGRGADENGWASEDVTDVQEAGDFNFEDGLRKFDKQTLFEQMRQDDRIDEADRLVSHNRMQRPRPGTNGGRNYHASENVLDVPSPIPKSVRENIEASADYWNSEADEGVSRGSGRLSGRDQGSRQSSHRRAESKVSTTRRSQSRKASAVSNQPLVTKGSRPSSRLSVPPVVDKKKRSGGNAASSSQGLYLLPSNRQVEPVSALQMLNLENIAHTELGLTEDMMAENAGRGIAEVTLTALEDPAIKVRLAATANSRSRANPPPTVVILAGNNKSGIRAVAAGRHLLNKGVTVLVCIIGIERNERELLEDMRHQVQLFRNFGGHIFSKGELFDYMRKASIPTLTIDTPRTALSSLATPPPVTLIIDALLGLAISFEELRTGDQTACYELIEWANRNEAFVLAIDVPTGIDPSSGKVSIVDGSQLYVKPRYVVCVGAPKRGLLEAIIAGDQDNDEAASANPALTDDLASEWKLFLVDIGFSQAVWKKAGTKIRKGIDFGLEWVVEMRYRGASVEEGQ
jgi:enhancer of mRNA-decapping protein 3